MALSASAWRKNSSIAFDDHGCPGRKGTRRVAERESLRAVLTETEADSKVGRGLHSNTTGRMPDSDEAARVYRALSAHRSKLMPPIILI